MNKIDLLFIICLLALYFLPRKSKNHKYYWIIPLLVFFLSIGIRINSKIESRKSSKKIEGLNTQVVSLKDELEKTKKLAEPSTISISKIIKGGYDKYDGYSYKIEFVPSKNKSLNKIDIKLKIDESSNAYFTGLAGFSSYINKRMNISEDKKSINYQISMKPGSDPVVGFFVSEPTKIIISGNYGLETQNLKLE